MAVSGPTGPEGQPLTGLAAARARLGNLQRQASGRGEAEALQDRVAALEDQVVVLEDQVVALEAELADNRALHRRLAELTDVVTELCVPLVERDRTGVAEVLKRYRQSL